MIRRTTSAKETSNVWMVLDSALESLAMRHQDNETVLSKGRAKALTQNLLLESLVTLVWQKDEVKAWRRLFLVAFLSNGNHSFTITITERYKNAVVRITLMENTEMRVTSRWLTSHVFMIDITIFRDPLTSGGVCMKSEDKDNMELLSLRIGRKEWNPTFLRNAKIEVSREEDASLKSNCQKLEKSTL